MQSGSLPTSTGPRSTNTSESNAHDTETSPKSYAIAVALSGIFGFIGVQHFYLERWFEGCLDVALTIGWVTCFFFIAEPIYGLLFLAADLSHSLIVSITLMIGSYHDGQGRLVCYPGQKLPKEVSEPLRHTPSSDPNSKTTNQ